LTRKLFGVFVPCAASTTDVEMEPKQKRSRQRTITDPPRHRTMHPLVACDKWRLYPISTSPITSDSTLIRLITLLKQNSNRLFRVLRIAKSGSEHDPVLPSLRRSEPRRRRLVRHAHRHAVSVSIGDCTYWPHLRQYPAGTRIITCRQTQSHD
jgi:hypothetical protein